MPQSIYIHLPFCKTKCPYCDFASFANASDKFEKYIQSLLAEIDKRLNTVTKRSLIKTIFLVAAHQASTQQLKLKLY